MWELLKDYLENNEIHSYKDVKISNYIEDGHKVEVIFGHDGSKYDVKATLSLWEVMVYVHSKK